MKVLSTTVKYATLLCTLLLIDSIKLKAQDLNISGGNSVSVSLCANGGIFAWGANSQGSPTTYYGRLGTGDYTSATINTPQQVNVPPAALPIAQVDAGSGGHFIAMGCDGTVWGWGNNGNQQVGNTDSVRQLVTGPTQVMAGEGTDSDFDGFLDGVSYISGGNDENFAILANGRLVAWGQNDRGQLGNGTTVDSPTPVLVREPGGIPLENVIMVEAGDQTGYALVDDDGDGLGTVYSWGDAADHRLGRNPDNGNDVWAQPVVYEGSGLPITDISTITAGDGTGYGIDKDGYVWSWGHAAWGQQTGRNTNTPHFAAQVLGGATGTTFLQAKQISAGQGFGMAVTLDGRAVAWGNNGGGTNGGNLGDCGSSASGEPVYMLTAPGVPITNVTSISDGDFWGFITKDDNTIWTWGGNNVGQLGLGTIGGIESCVVQMPAIPSCTFPDPIPTANLGVDTISTCAPVSELLDPNFVNLNNEYDITWYLNDAPVYTGKTVPYTANAFGEWKVQIDYVGTDAPCNAYEPALDSVQIIQNPTTYSDPGGLTFCGANITANVNGNGAYEWFTATTGGSSLGTSSGSGDVTFPAASVTDIVGSIHTVYVEETAALAGTVIETEPGDGSPNSVSGGQFTGSEMFFSVSETVTIDSMALHVRSYSGNATLTVQFQVYNSKSACGSKIVGDKTSIVATGSGPYVINSAPTTFTRIDVPVGITVGPGDYFIGVTAGSSIANGAVAFFDGEPGLPYTGNDMSGSNTPRVDNVTGNIISTYGSDKQDCFSNNGELGMFYDWRFRTQPSACARVAVAIDNSCPCSNPVIDAGAPFAVCEGQAINLSASGATGTNPVYSWRGPSAWTGSGATPNVTGSAVNATHEGWYYVSYVDDDCASPSPEDSVFVTVNTVPAAPTAGNNGPVCEGQQLDLTASNIAGATYAWTGPLAYSSATQNPTVSASATTGMAGMYSVTATVAGCTGPAGTTTVTVNAVPAAPTAGNNGPVCEGTQLDLTASNIAGATYAWTGPLAYSSATQNPTVSASATTGMAGMYSVTATVAGCTGPAGTTTVTVNAVPAAPTAGNNGPVCEGTQLDLTASNIAGATYAWTGPLAYSSATQNPTVSASATPAMSGTYNVTATVAGCTGPAGSTNVTVNATPAAPTAGNNGPVCEGTQLDLTASNIAGATYAWTGPLAYSSATQNPTVSASATTGMAGMYSVTATVAGCMGPAGTTTVTVNAVPAAPSAGNNGPICEGTQLDLTASNIAGATYAWTGPLAYSSGTQNPTVSASATTGMAGMYSVTATVAGCTGPAGTTTVTVNATPAAPTAGNNGPVCEGTQLDLTASNIAGATYAWTGPLAYSSATQNPTVSASATTGMAGMYSVTATVAGCTGPAGTTTVTVNAIPAAPTAGNNGPICEGTQLDLTASNIAGATYAWTGPLAYSNATQNPTVSASATTGMAGMYSVTATAAGCTGPAGTTTVTVNATPAAPTAGNNGPVCEGAQLDLTASNIAGATYAWTGPLAYTSAAQNPTVSGSATAGMAGMYSVTATVAGCTGPAGTTTVTVNALPTATLSGTASICDDGVTTTPLTITFTGSGTFNIDLDTTGGTHTSLAGVSSPHVVNVMADQTYSISNLTDANCTGTSTTGTATITYLDDVIATTSLECDDVNPALAGDEFQIRVTVTQGDLASINVSELTAHGVIFTDQGGGVWLSNAVNEANSVDINVTDVNDCNNGIDLNSLQQQCSCPASGGIALSGADPVCPGASSSLDATFSTTIGVGPFNLTVTRPISGDTVLNGVTSVFTLPIDEVGAYSASVEDVGNACSVSLTGSVSLSNHALPTADITGTAVICDDGATTAPLTITFTGSGPFTIDVDTTGGNYSTEAGVTSPHVVNVMADQTYTISNLSDANCAGTATTGSATITYLDDVLANTATECDDINPALAADEFQVRVTITQGDVPSAVLTELTAHGITFTDQGGGVWLSSAINEADSLDVNVSDMNNCNGGINLTDINTRCSCPASGSIAITGATTVCPGASSTLDATFSTVIGVGPFNLTVTRPGSGDTTINSATSVFSLPIDEVGAYTARVEDVGNSCTVNLTGSPSLANHTLPTATITGGANICDDGVTTTPLTITFTGATNFNIDLDTAGGTHTSITNVTSPHVINVMADQTYTISNVSDANCPGTSTTGTAVVGYLDDVVATTSLECDDVNPALANDEFQIRVTITQGDLASAAISELTAHGVTFTDQGGGVWLSNAVNEANAVDINVTDVNDCNSGLNITGLQQQCSCPASGTIALSGAATVCPGASSSLDATFSTTVGVGPFNLTVTRPISGDTVFNSATSVLTLPIDEVGAYSATVEDVGNGCTVSLTGSVSLANHPLPTAVITGDNSICNDGATTAPLTVTFTGTGPFTIDVDTTGGNYSNEAGVTSPHVVNVMADQTYSISNVSDANCPGTSTTGTATITYLDDVLANTALECNNINPALANDEFQIRVTVTQGDQPSVAISELTAHGITFTDQGGGVWLSNAVNELNSVDINVTDGNNCNGGLNITALQQQCTCPTSASAVIGTGTVCPDSATTLDISWVDGGISTTYDLEITTPAGVQNFNNVTSPHQINITDVGNYTARVTDNGDACDAFTVPVALSNHPLPTSAIALNGSGTICDNGTDQATIDVTFTGTASFTFTYTDGVTPTTLTTSSNPHSINTMTAGTYTVTSVVDGNNCPASSMTGSATVTLVPLPTPTVAGGPGTFCDGQGAHVLTASGITVGNSYEWYQNGSPTGIVDQNLTVTDLSGAGTYTVVETSAVCGDITSSNSEVITVNPIPSVDAGLPPDPFFAGEPGTLNGSSNGTTFSWSPAADAQSPTALATVITPAASGFFTLTASNGNCSASDSVYVTVWEPIRVPNAFTPNFDSENDTWEIEGLTSYPNATVTVFNRWGNQVYKSIGTYKPWDGFRNGDEMPIGTYYYIIEPSDNLAPMSGSVTLVR